MQKSSSTPPETQDTRVVCGASCTWWDDISQVGRRDKLPCCPHCGGMLFEFPTMDDFLVGAIAHDKTNPGYLDMLRWARGNCFKGADAAAEAYKHRNAHGPFHK